MKKKVLTSFGTILTLTVLATSCRFKDFGKEKVVLDKLYEEEFGFDEDKINTESVKNITNELYSCLGDNFYISYEFSDEDYKSIFLSNDTNQEVNLMYLYENDILSINYFDYSNQNINNTSQTYDDYIVLRKYMAKEENTDNYYCIDYENLDETNRSIIYKSDNTISISIYKDIFGYYLFFNGNTSCNIKINEDDYISLLLIMNRYSSGNNLEEFINEDVIQKYLDILQIRCPELYDEFGHLTDDRKLRLII